MPEQPPAPATLDHAAIAARIPHQGRMCLLDRVLDWDSTQIRCSAKSHRDPANPLLSGAALASPCAIEYASQAMALHGTLTAADAAPPSAGMLAGVRGVRLLQPRLDTVDGDVVVSARRLAGDTRSALYAFALHDAAGALLVDGRATVILNPAP